MGEEHILIKCSNTSNKRTCIKNGGIPPVKIVDSCCGLTGPCQCIPYVSNVELVVTIGHTDFPDYTCKGT